MERRIPRRYKEMYERAMTGKDKQASIRSFCLECCGYAYIELDKCTNAGCPLYPHRLKGPGKTLKMSARERKRVQERAKQFFGTKEPEKQTQAELLT